MSAHYTGFCLEFPAFLDCSLSLMRRPFAELRDAVLFRLGQAMAACLGHVAGVLGERAGGPPRLSGGRTGPRPRAPRGQRHLAR